jgi:hypothetical protein
MVWTPGWIVALDAGAQLGAADAGPAAASATTAAAAITAALIPLPT